jgi:hypothetical protein
MGSNERNIPILLMLGIDLAETIALMQRCGNLKIKRELIYLGSTIEGKYECNEPERVCEELLWRINEALEKLGYTALYKVWPNSKQFVFVAYSNPEDMLPIEGVRSVQHKVQS